MKTTEGLKERQLRAPRNGMRLRDRTRTDSKGTGKIYNPRPRQRPFEFRPRFQAG